MNKLVAASVSLPIPLFRNSNGDLDWRIFTGDEIATLFGWHRLQKAKGRFIHDRLPMGSDNQMVNRLKAAKRNWFFIASAVSSKVLKTMARMEGMRFEVGVRFPGSKK